MKDTKEYSFLPWVAVNRPITVLMGLLTTLVLGVIAYTKIPIEMLPSGMEGKRLSVRVLYPNSTPLDTLDKVVRPMEDILGTVAGVERVQTRAFSTQGRAYIFFHPDRDMKEAYADVKDRMDRILPELPEDADDIRVYTYDQDDKDIIEAAMTLGEEIEDVEFFIDRYIQPALERIDGVGDVDIKGFGRREVEVAFDQEKLKAHNIDIYQLTNSLRLENYTLSAGKIDESGNEYLVRSVGKIDQLEVLGDLIVDKELGLRLKDIAEIRQDRQADHGTWRLEGSRSFGVDIKRSSEANIVEISRAVKRVFDRFERSKRWPGIEFYTFFDQGDHILESVNNLRNSALWGCAFSFVVLMAFLRSAKITLTITLAIPLSLLCAIVVLYFMGWTMNMLTMMGLLVSVGLVVDNAIVMVENIFSKRENGLEAKKAALKGASEVGLAVTMATLTTIIVFVPLLLMDSGGEMKFFMQKIGLTVISALLASLIIALVLIPMATSKFKKLSSARKREVRTGWLNRIYQRVLASVLRDRMHAVCLILVVGVLTYWPIKEEMIGSGGGRSSDTRVHVSLSMPSGLLKEEVGAIVASMESYLEENRGRFNFETYSSYHSSDYAFMRIKLKSEDMDWYQIAYRGIIDTLGLRGDSGMTREDIIDNLMENLPLPPGSKLRIAGESSGDPTRSFGITLYGDDTETLYALSGEVERRLRTVEGLLAIETDTEENNQELGIRIDRDKAVRLGINPRDVSGAISYAMRGASLGDFSIDGGTEMPIRAKVDEDDRQTMNELRTLTFEADDGTEVPLENITDLSFRDTSRSIMRYDRKTSLRIRAVVDIADVRELFRKIDGVMEGFEMPEGYSWDKGGSSRRIKRDNDDMQFAIILMVIFVVFLMGILFESFILPIAVLANMLLALVGVVWMCVWTDTPFSRLGMLGALLLGGIVVNNGIVLIDLAMRLMKQGYSRTEALLEASRQRFRPIWITSLTTMFGMMPMAIGGAKLVNESYAPMGRVIISGLLISTLLTVIAVPLFYVLLDDLRNWALGWLNRIVLRKKTEAMAVAED
ncbi:MAG: efflux RND transporter permease subunit [Verrucomicrobiota bacterium]